MEQERERMAIDLTDHDAVMYWCGRLAVSEKQLEAAVTRVGTMPAAVEYFFRSRTGVVRLVPDDETRRKVEETRERRKKHKRYTPGPAQVKREPR